MAAPARAKNIAATGTIDLTYSGDGHTLLHCIVVGTGAASAVLTVTDGDGGAVSIIDASAKGYYEFCGARCHKGVKAVLSGGNANCTLVYS